MNTEKITIIEETNRDRLLLYVDDYDIHIITEYKIEDGWLENKVMVLSKEEINKIIDVIKPKNKKTFVDVRFRAEDFKD